MYFLSKVVFLSDFGVCMDWKSARWIWLNDEEKKSFSHVVFQRDFRLDRLPEQAVFSLSACTGYRLRINGQWCADGPARACPEHYSFDVLECSYLLRRGLNRIEAEVHFDKNIDPVFSSGALLALLELCFPDGETEYVVSDNSWMSAVIPERMQDSDPDFSEYFNAAAEEIPEFFQSAIVCGPEAGVWKKLSARSAPMLTRCEALVRRVLSVKLSRRENEVSGDSYDLAEENTIALPSVVENIQALIYPDDRCTTIHPADGRDVMLCCDLGSCNAGYWNFVLYAPAGTVIDLFTSETAEHDFDRTGCIRYVCRRGWNRFTGITRVAGRYLFIRISEMTGDVRIQSLRLVESTYPAVLCGDFSSSDRRLDDVWNTAVNTLKLCMSDVLADVPAGTDDFNLKTLRTQTAAALSCFGAEDIVQRSIDYAADLLKRKLVSGVSGVAPVDFFCFLLTLRDFDNELDRCDSVKKHYPLLKELAEYFERNVDPETGLLKTDGELFRIADSLMFKGSLDMMSAYVDEPEVSGHFSTLAAGLTAAVNRFWDDRRLAYFDAVDPAGTPVPEYSMNTSMLAVLFDVIPENRRAAACANTVSPRNELKNDSSPFAVLLWLETLEKLGMPEQISEKLGTLSCASAEQYHGACAIPLYAFPRVLLGVKTSDGCRKISVSPRVSGMEYASGKRWTPAGPLCIRWRKEGDMLSVDVDAPHGVEVVFENNLSMYEYEVKFNVNISCEV